MTKPFTRSNAGQMSLLSDPFTHEHPTMGRTVNRQKFVAPGTAGHAKALWLLLNGPQPLPQLQRLMTVDDDKLLHALRALGLELPCYSISTLDDTGRPVECQVCALTERDMQRVKRWLRRQGAGQ